MNQIGFRQRPSATSSPRLAATSRLSIGLAYVLGYVVLDWVSSIGPFAPIGITPWNPNIGLGFVLVPLFGRKFIPLLFVAPLASDLILRGFPFPWAVELLLAAATGGGYAAGLILLTFPAARFNAALKSMRDLIILISAAALSSTIAAAAHVAILVSADLLARGDAVSAALQSWVGDMIGIAVVAPFGLVALTRGRMFKISAEMAAQVLAILAAMVLIFFSEERYNIQLFYLLFAPIIWMAVRGGLELVTTGVLIAQLGLIVALNILPTGEVAVAAYQAVMLVLALTGLVAGALVAERSRAEAVLRLHQDSLARLARLAGAGELAAAVAHEINQPLMAAGTYVRLVVRSLRAESSDNRTTVEAAEKAAWQVERAAEVVRRLRALVQLDKSGRAPASVERIIKESLDLSRPILEKHGIATRVALDGKLPQVVVDVLQVEQALLNLIRNSVEALSIAGDGGTITLSASPSAGNFVEVVVEDTGPGFPPELSSPLPLVSSKAEGLGVGLSLCRSIVEAHGGRLRVNDPALGGASVSFTLPTANSSDG
jgi:signal transduction histidine kinase